MNPQHLEQHLSQGSRCWINLCWITKCLFKSPQSQKQIQLCPLNKPKAPAVNTGSPVLPMYDVRGSSSWVIQASRAIFRPKNSRRMIHEEPENFVHFTSVAQWEIPLFPLVNGRNTQASWHCFLKHFNQEFNRPFENV